MNHRLTYLFLVEYFRTHKVKTFFSLLGIMLSVALFVTTTFNGERAEKSLIDFSMGYFGENFQARIKNANDKIGLVDTDIEKIFYNEELRFIEGIYPRIQKSAQIKTQNEVVNVIYQGIDIVKESSELKQKKSCEDCDSETFISAALYEKIGSNSFYFKVDEKLYEIKNAIVLDSEGGLFILEDLDQTKERFHQTNYDFILLKTIGLDSNKISILKTNLSAIHANLQLETAEEIKARAANVLKSFHLNLIIISMISVLIAFFMVSNTMTGIFLNRKKELGILRCLGTSQAENLFLFLSQSILLGIIGTGLGIILGAFLSKHSLFSGESTLTDANQSISYSRIPVKIILMSSLIGIAGSFFSGLFPALRSARLAPITIVRDNPILTGRNHFKKLFYLGIVFILIAYIISQIKTNSSIPIFGLISIGMIIVGQTLCFPQLMKIFLSFANYFLNRIDQSFIETRIGFEEIVQNSLKNTLTSATLMLGVSLIVSLSVLTQSYEKSIVDWTEREFPFDYSIVNRRDLEEGADIGVPISIPKKISQLSNIAEVDVFVLNTKAEVGDKIFTIHAYDMDLTKKRELKNGIITHKDIDIEKEILVSANMAYLNHLERGDTILLNTRQGKVKLKIAGTREHFFSENGTILMDYRLYDKLFGVEKFSSVRVNFTDKKKLDETLENLKTALVEYPDLKPINSNELKNIYLSGLKKVFKVLDSLKYTAAVIAFVSLFSSILYNLNDKLRIFGVFRSIGAGAGQLNRIIFSENLFLTFFGVIMGILSSLLLNPIIIHVINKTAFGWTLSIQIPYDLIWLCLGSIPIVSFLTAMYPFLLVQKLSLREILSYE